MWKKRLFLLLGAGSSCVIAWGFLKFVFPDILTRKKFVRLQPLSKQSEKRSRALEKLAPLFALKQTAEDSSIRSRGASLAIKEITSFEISPDVETSELKAAFLLLGNLCTYPQFVPEFSDSLPQIFDVVCEICKNETMFRDEIIAAMKFLSNLCLTSEFIEWVTSSCCLKAVVMLLLRSSTSVCVREQALTFLVNISSHRITIANSKITEEFRLQGLTVEQWFEDSAAKIGKSEVEIEKTNYLLKNLGLQFNN